MRKIYLLIALWSFINCSKKNFNIDTQLHLSFVGFDTISITTYNSTKTIYKVKTKRFSDTIQINFKEGLFKKLNNIFIIDSNIKYVKYNNLIWHVEKDKNYNYQYLSAFITYTNSKNKRLVHPFDSAHKQ